MLKLSNYRQKKHRQLYVRTKISSSRGKKHNKSILTINNEMQTFTHRHTSHYLIKPISNIYTHGKFWRPIRILQLKSKQMCCIDCLIVLFFLNTVKMRTKNSKKTSHILSIVSFFYFFLRIWYFHSEIMLV